MPNSLRSRFLVRDRLPFSAPADSVPAGRRHPPPADAETPGADAMAPACGWYESSFALRQGLAVCELGDGDASLAAFGFVVPPTAGRAAPGWQ